MKRQGRSLHLSSVWEPLPGEMALPVKPSMTAIHEAWAVLRVRQWLIFAPLPAAGVLRWDELLGRRWLEIVGAMVVSGLSLGYAYGINAIFDRASDEDAQKNVLAGRERVPLAAIVSVILSGLLALGGASVLGHVALAAIGVSIAAGTLYSAGLRLKHFPVIGLLGNWLIFAPLMAVALRVESIPKGFPALFTVFTLLVTQNQLMHEESDMSEDTLAGAWTTARWLGVRGTRLTLWALALGIGLAGTMAPSSMGFGICVVAAGLSAMIATFVEPAKKRRTLHRYLSGVMGGVLFVATLHV